MDLFSLAAAVLHIPSTHVSPIFSTRNSKMYQNKNFEQHRTNKEPSSLLHKHKTIGVSYTDRQPNMTIITTNSPECSRQLFLMT